MSNLPSRRRFINISDQINNVVPINNLNSKFNIISSSTPVINSSIPTPVINTPVINSSIPTPVINNPVINTPVINNPVINTPVINTPVINSSIPTPVTNSSIPTPVINKLSVYIIFNTIIPTPVFNLITNIQAINSNITIKTYLVKNTNINTIISEIKNDNNLKYMVIDPTIINSFNELNIPLSIYNVKTISNKIVMNHIHNILFNVQNVHLHI